MDERKMELLYEALCYSQPVSLINAGGDGVIGNASRELGIDSAVILLAIGIFTSFPGINQGRFKTMLRSALTYFSYLQRI